MNFQWFGDDVEEKLLALMAQRMQLATVFVQGEVRKAINRGNASGKNPSAPGEPPKKVTGRLFRSIATAVSVTATQIVGSIGTGVIYGRRLELGYVGKDSRGHQVNSAPRPYLRVTLTRVWNQVQSILATGRP